MRYHGVNLMVPTYNRADTRLPEFISSALAMADDKSNVYFSFMLHKGDDASKECIERIVDKDQYDILWEAEEKPHLAKFWNRLYRETRFQDPGLMVSMVGDDMVFRSKGWDTLLLKWCNAVDGVGGFFGDDCRNVHETFMVNIFTTRKIVDALSPKPFMCELFPCNDMDVVWDLIFRKIERRFYISRFKLYHNHATFTAGNMDNVWRRLMETLPDVNKNKHLTGPYVDECVASIKEKLAGELRDENIQVIMATHDRLDLLDSTVSSYNDSARLPQCIDVYDDCSTKIERVRALVGQMRGAVSHESAVWARVDAKTPAILQEKFDAGAEAVFIIDSDAVFYKHWWTVLNHQYRALKDSKDFAAIVLANLSHTPPGTDMCVRTSGTGAFGLLITRDYWLSFVKPFESSGYGSWDRRSAQAALRAGKHIYATSPSMMQHIGNLDGSHVGGGGVMGTTANDFEGDVVFFNKFAKNAKVDAKTVLLACFGRNGNIVHASLYANQLIKLGYSVTWLTLQFYKGLVAAVCPGASVQVPLGEPMSEWGYTDTYEMSKNYPGFGYYLNAQISSPEHYSALAGSGLSVVDYLKSHVESVTGEKLDTTPLAHAEFKHFPYGYPTGGKPLCIIAPETRGGMFWDEDTLVRMYEEYSVGYDVRILAREFPNASRLRRRYLARLSFAGAIALMREASLFVGVNSGLAWGSLYGSGDKKVHHRNRRTLVRYSKLDSKCEDIFPGGQHG